MRPFKWITTLMFIVIGVSSLTGCWDKRELDRKAYVIGIGLDKDEQQGKIMVTYLIANPEVGSQQSGGGTNEPTQEILSLTGSDFISSRNTANAVITREISYDLLRVIIVSEEFAKDPDFIRWIYSATKDREIKRSTHLIVTKEKAKTFINKNKPKLETRPHKYFEFIMQRGIDTGLIPDADLNNYYRVTESDADLFLAIYATTETDNSNPANGADDNFLAGEAKMQGLTNDPQFIGSAVFKEGKMIGKITGEQTRISTILDDTQNFKDILTVFPDPFNERYQISVRMFKNEENKIKMNLENGRPKIDITIPLFIDVLSDPSMINYAKNKDKVAKLKQSLTKDIESKIKKFIDWSKEEYKGEMFHWSLAARKEFSTLREFRDFNWMKSYPNAEVEVKVDIRFGEFGRQSKLPELDEVRD